MSSSDATPRPSATVILLRETATGPETFLVRRHDNTVFGDMWAFPGGVLDADDARIGDALAGIAEDEANALLETPNALMYYSAAVRELFEESGVLLGHTAAVADELAAFRDRLNSGGLAWRDFVVEARCRFDAGALHYLSYWITPRGLGKRFATRFFAAAMPPGQTAEHCGRELTESTWLTPAEALAIHGSGDLPMIPPTRMTLEVLARHDSVAAALDAADATAAEGIVAILPKAVVHEGQRTILMPGEPGYADAS